jgi:general secretion pathway protein K
MPVLHRNNQSGLALLLVMFLVALASILVINLTYSTYLGSRLSNSIEKSVQAEYLLKSALNYARVLIKADETEEDSNKDEWGKFANGVSIPAEYLDIPVKNVNIELEIRPEGAKMNIKSIVPRTLNGQPDTRWRGVLERLFQQLGFDNDGEVPGPGQYEDMTFGTKELVANFIDYVDEDRDSYDSDGFRGIENENSGFPNTQISRIGEISAIPGFTAARMQKLMPFLTTQDNLRININLAAKILIQSLHPDIDANQVDQIISFRNSEEGPFQNISKLQEFVSSDVFDQIQSLITVQSNRFQVLAKVDFGTSTSYLRAFVSKVGRNQLPIIQSLELF